MTTTVKLTPELARFVDEKVKAGDYPDVETLVTEALREKAERDAAYEPWAEAHIEQALLDVQSGTAKYANLKVVSAYRSSTRVWYGCCWPLYLLAPLGSMRM